MAFNVTSQTARLVESFGHKSELCVGMTTMSCGSATVTAQPLRRIDGIVGMVQGSTGAGETVICTATSDNTADLETIDEAGCVAGSSVVMWIAWGQAKM